MKKEYPLIANLAYNALKEETPEIVKLVIINNDEFTKSIMAEKMKTDSTSIPARDMAEEAVLFAKALASSLKDHETDSVFDGLISSLENIGLVEDELSLLRSIDNTAKKIGKNPEYTAVMNVMITVLHCGLNY